MMCFAKEYGYSNVETESFDTAPVEQGRFFTTKTRRKTRPSARRVLGVLGLAFLRAFVVKKTPAYPRPLPIWLSATKSVG